MSSSRTDPGEMPSVKNAWDETGPQVPTRTMSPNVAPSKSPVTALRLASSKNYRFTRSSRRKYGFCGNVPYVASSIFRIGRGPLSSDTAPWHAAVSSESAPSPGPPSQPRAETHPEADER